MMNFNNYSSQPRYNAYGNYSVPSYGTTQVQQQQYGNSYGNMGMGGYPQMQQQPYGAQAYGAATQQPNILQQLLALLGLGKPQGAQSYGGLGQGMGMGLNLGQLGQYAQTGMQRVGQYAGQGMQRAGQYLQDHPYQSMAMGGMGAAAMSGVCPYAAGTSMMMGAMPAIQNWMGGGNR
jgi:hypothetical protein